MQKKYGVLFPVFATSEEEVQAKISLALNMKERFLGLASNSKKFTILTFLVATRYDCGATARTLRKAIDAGGLVPNVSVLETSGPHLRALQCGMKELQRCRASHALVLNEGIIPHFTGQFLQVVDSALNMDPHMVGIAFEQIRDEQLRNPFAALHIQSLLATDCFTDAGTDEMDSTTQLCSKFGGDELDLYQEHSLTNLDGLKCLGKFVSVRV